MMSKLVPSPDWFVGLDSLNLCENGHFIDSVTVEVSYLGSRYTANYNLTHCAQLSFLVMSEFCFQFFVPIKFGR